MRTVTNTATHPPTHPPPTPSPLLHTNANTRRCPDLVSASRLNDILAAVIRAHRRCGEDSAPKSELLQTRLTLTVRATSDSDWLDAR